MNCTEARELINNLDQLAQDSAQYSNLEKHIIECASCKTYHNDISDIITMVDHQAKLSAPEYLTEKIVDALNQEHAHSARKTTNTWLKPLITHTFALAAGAAIAMLFAGQLFFVKPSLHELVDLHSDALTNTLYHIESNERHTIKPWLAKNLGLSPNVKDFSELGFPLTGARIEQHHSHLAALVYKRRKHIINLFITTKNYNQFKTKQHFSQNGFNVIELQHNDFIYWAVSDLNKKELNEFLNIVKQSNMQ